MGGLSPKRLLVVATAVAAVSAAGCRKAEHSPPPARVEAVRLEGQPAADLGDGRFRNPVLAGEFPDPSLVRVGGDYYMTHTPGAWTPGLLVWHSRDLVNWEPLGHAVNRPIGDIWAPDLVFHKGLFYIYFPARVRDVDGGFRQTCFVTTAADPRGPWSEPVDLNVAAIDPGHAADENGDRFLYVDGGRMIRLTPDGLKTEGELTKVYDGWDFPGDWNVECKCLESPKIARHGGFFYLVSAQGGTAGPSTSHMIVVARSESPAGPWQNSPYNPLLRTASRREKWWSQGHGTIFEAADGGWWVVYHAFENGWRTLGRQTLLLPVEWTSDGWPRIRAGADPAAVTVKPVGEDVGHGLPLSDDFSGPALGFQWRRPVFGGGLAAGAGLRTGGGFLSLEACGGSVKDANLISLAPVNHAYEVSVAVRAAATAEAGLLLYYDGGRFTGVAVKQGEVFTYVRGRAADSAALSAPVAHLMVRNDEHDVSFFFSGDGRTWTRFETGAEVSGFHHESFSGWGTLRVALYAAGAGEAVFSDFRYRGFK